MEIKIDGFTAMWIAWGAGLIALGVFLDLLPGDLPTSLNAIASCALAGGIVIVAILIAAKLTRDRDDSLDD